MSIHAIVKHGNGTTIDGLGRAGVPIYGTRPGRAKHVHLIDSDLWNHYVATSTHYKGCARDFEVIGEYADGEVPADVCNGDYLGPRDIGARDIPRIRSIRYLEWLSAHHHEPDVRRMCQRQIKGVESGMVGPQLADDALYRVYGRMEKTAAVAIENPKAVDLTFETSRLILRGPPNGIHGEMWMFPAALNAPTLWA